MEFEFRVASTPSRELAAECRIRSTLPQRNRFGAAVIAIAAVSCLAAAACEPVSERVAAELDRERAVAARVLDREYTRIEAVLDSIDAVLQPLPLLRPTEETALRANLSARHLERARALGISPGLTRAQLERLVSTGDLVAIDDANAFWVVRKLDYSTALVTPAAHAALIEIGRRFHERLDGLGLPRFRFEITSALRTAEDQARLRTVNPNAAAGVSTHEYATTFDIAYSAFAPPELPIHAVRVDSAEWIEPHVRRVERQAAATLAARRARELQAVLGQVLIELQARGTVMVTLEQLQPVFHVTVATAEP